MSINKNINITSWQVDKRIFHILKNKLEPRTSAYGNCKSLLTGLDEVALIAVIKEDLQGDKKKRNFIRNDARAKKAIMASINKTILTHILNFILNVASNWYRYP